MIFNYNANLAKIGLELGRWGIFFGFRKVSRKGAKKQSRKEKTLGTQRRRVNGENTMFFSAPTAPLRAIIPKMTY
jgi:hypothetical protein